MKKVLLFVAALSLGAATVSAQYALVKPKFGDNISLGVEGGVTTPLNNGPFFKSMRGVIGLNVKKQLTPTFGLGVEGLWGFNTSSWKGAVHSSTAFDSQYIGAFGSVNLFNLFTPYSPEPRVFDMDIQAGAGWGHEYRNKAAGPDHNFFATKAGLNFNFYPCERVAISLKPAVIYNMSDRGARQSSASYNSHRAVFNLTAGVSVLLGDGFKYVLPNYNLDEVAALNEQINTLRSDLGAASQALTQVVTSNKALQSEVNALQNRKPEVVNTTNDFLSTVRYVNFNIGRYNVTADQMPNVAAVANYLKNQPKSTVVIKGYASQDGPIEVNERLARQRAESVRDLLVKRYGIAPERIKAEGEGIGHMFEEESWNRVAICTLDNNAPVSTKTNVSK